MKLKTCGIISSKLALGLDKVNFCLDRFILDIFNLMRHFESGDYDLFLRKNPKILIWPG